MIKHQNNFPNSVLKQLLHCLQNMREVIKKLIAVFSLFLLTFLEVCLCPVVWAIVRSVLHIRS